MVGVEEGREFRFRGDLYSQESTFPLVGYWDSYGRIESIRIAELKLDVYINFDSAQTVVSYRLPTNIDSTLSLRVMSSRFLGLFSF